MDDGFNDYRDIDPNFDRRVDQCFERARALRLTTHKGNAAKDLQRAIRLEWACRESSMAAVFDNTTGSYDVIEIHAPLGFCVCVTCGDVDDYRNMDSGHFLSRKHTSILFDERQIHPQCRTCNNHGNGNRNVYTVFMNAVYGEDVVAELHRLQHEPCQPDREYLCRVRVSSAIRTKLAKMTLEGLDVAKVKRKASARKKTTTRKPDAKGQAYLPDEDAPDGTMAPERIPELDSVLEDFLGAKMDLAENRETMASASEKIAELLQEHDVQGTYRIDFESQTYDFSLVLGQKVKHHKVKIED